MRPRLRDPASSSRNLEHTFLQRTSLDGPVQERLSVGVDVVDVRLVLDERLCEGLLPAAAAAAQRDVQREEVALVEAVDADGELEGKINNSR